MTLDKLFDSGIYGEISTTRNGNVRRLTIGHNYINGNVRRLTDRGKSLKSSVALSATTLFPRMDATVLSFFFQKRFFDSLAIAQAMMAEEGTLPNTDGPRPVWQPAQQTASSIVTLGFVAFCISGIDGFVLEKSQSPHWSLHLLPLLPLLPYAVTV